jgi:secreted PhoX family phosphatase
MFTPNNHTLFCSVQHSGAGSDLDDPSSIWPDQAFPPRASMIAAEKAEGNHVIAS